MKSLKIIAITIFITLYEVLLIDYAANNFSLARNWFWIVDSMPVLQTNVEFVILLGQIPLLFLLGYFWVRKRQKIEEDFLEKYGKK